MKKKIAEYSSSKIFDIWHNKEKYRPEVIELIEAEMDHRGLDKTHMLIEDQSANDQLLINTTNNILSFINNAPKAAIAFFYPIKAKENFLSIHAVALGFLVIAAYSLYQRYLSILFFEFGFSENNIFLLLDIAWVVILPLIISILIYQQKTSGWYLGFFFLTYRLLFFIPTFVLTLKYWEQLYGSNIHYDIAEIIFFLILFARLVNFYVRSSCQIKIKTAWTILLLVGFYTIYSSTKYLREVEHLFNY